MSAPQTTLSKDEAGPKTSWDPKKFVCDHNAYRPILAEKISFNSKRCEVLVSKLETNEEKLDDMEFFFKKFGNDYSHNIVTSKIELYSVLKYDRQSELEEEIKELKKELSDFHEELAQVEENAKDLDCPCLKTRL